MAPDGRSTVPARILSAARALLPVAAGVASGFVAVALMTPAEAPPVREIRVVTESAGPASESHAWAPPLPVPADGGTALLHMPAEGTASTAVTQQEEDPFARRARLTAMREAEQLGWIAAHSAEPIAPDFAVRARGALEPEVGEVAEASGGRVASVDCRTTSCIVTVQWPDYSAAQRSMRELIGASYSVRCDRILRIPAPPDPSEPYIGVLLLRDCRE